MNRRGLSWMIGLLAWQAGWTASYGMAARPTAPSLLVVPAHFAPLQVGFDMTERYSTVLVAYQSQGVGRDPLLHVWDGAQWMRLGMEDMRTLSFLRVRPERILLVGDASTLPTTLVEATSGSPNQFVIPSTETAELVNHLAHFHGFRAADWRWFAARYNLDLADVNESRRQSSWFDQSSGEVRPFQWRRDGELRRAASQMSREAPRPAPVPPDTDAILEPPQLGMPPVEEYAPPVPVAPAVRPAAADSVPDLPTPIGIGPSAPPADWQERAVATEPPIK